MANSGKNFRVIAAALVASVSVVVIVSWFMRSPSPVISRMIDPHEVVVPEPASAVPEADIPAEEEEPRSFSNATRLAVSEIAYEETDEFTQRAISHQVRDGMQWIDGPESKSLHGAKDSPDGRYTAFLAREKKVNPSPESIVIWDRDTDEWFEMTAYPFAESFNNARVHDFAWTTQGKLIIEDLFYTGEKPRNISEETPEVENYYMSRTLSYRTTDPATGETVMFFSTSAPGNSHFAEMVEKENGEILIATTSPSADGSSLNLLSYARDGSIVSSQQFLFGTDVTLQELHMIPTDERVWFTLYEMDDETNIPRGSVSQIDAQGNVSQILSDSVLIDVDRTGEHLLLYHKPQDGTQQLWGLYDVGTDEFTPLAVDDYPIPLGFTDNDQGIYLLGWEQGFLANATGQRTMDSTGIFVAPLDGLIGPDGSLLGAASSESR